MGEVGFVKVVSAASCVAFVWRGRRGTHEKSGGRGRQAGAMLHDVALSADTARRGYLSRCELEMVSSENQSNPIPSVYDTAAYCTSHVVLCEISLLHIAVLEKNEKQTEPASAQLCCSSNQFGVALET